MRLSLDRILSAGAHLIFPTIAVVFILIRITNAGAIVFSDPNEVKLLGVDPYFHVRHAEYSAHNFPHLLRNDPGAHYPHHGRQEASGLFNLLIAGAAIVGSGFEPTRLSVEKAAAWTPVVLGFLSLLVLFWLGKYLGGFKTGIFSALIFTIYPGMSHYRSLVGFADQHVAEFLLAILSVACLVRCIDRESGTHELRWPRPALLLGAPLAAFFYTWMGTPLYIAVFALTIFVTLLLSLGNDARADTITRGLFRYFVGVAIWQIAVILFWPDLIMEVVPGMRWWNLGAMLAFATIPWLYIQFARTVRTRGVAPWIIAGSTLVIAGTALFFFFALLPQGQVFGKWLFGERATDVAEQSPVSVMRLWFQFGPAGFFALAAVPLIGVFWNTESSLKWAVLPTVFGLAITLIWYKTHDFDYVPPVFIALMAGLTIGYLIDRVGVLIATRPILKGFLPLHGLLISGLIGVVLLAPIMPLRIVSSPWLSIPEVLRILRSKPVWFDAMTWLENTSATPSIMPNSDILSDDPYPSDSYGIMTNWEYGNFVAHRARRIPVSSRYPSGTSAQWLTAETEAETDTLLCYKCRDAESIRYVVIDANMGTNWFITNALASNRPLEKRTDGELEIGGIRIPHTTYGDAFENAMVTRLMRDDGNRLSRYRLIYESKIQAISYYYGLSDIPGKMGLAYFSIYTDTQRARADSILANPMYPVGKTTYAYDGFVTSELKIFEVVSGAQLRAETIPGQELTLELPLFSSVTERSFTYTQTVVADSAGAALFKVPYWTTAVADDDLVKPTGSYTIFETFDRDGPHWTTADVTEDDVRLGTTVAVFAP